MKIQHFNDFLALVALGMVSILLGFLAWKETEMRTEILVLLGPWGTLVLQYYFRRQPPNGTTPPS